jgi:regulator of sigma E protease
MITIVIFILILGLLVFVHELGHFLIARRNGVRVEEFGFGFPPRIFGFYRNKKGERKFIWGNRPARNASLANASLRSDAGGEIEEIREARKVGEEKTVYSVNWIPLGGFVKITGEDGDEKDKPGSFASKSPFARIRILAAGVAMNFLLAIILFSFGFWLGVPQAAEEAAGAKIKGEKIQVVEVGKGTPAEAMGMRMGDEILGVIDPKGGTLKFSSVEAVQNFANENKGKEVVLAIKRGKEDLQLSGTPRAEFPEGEGPLGIALAKTVEARYPWHKAIWLGIQYTFSLTVTFVVFLFELIWRLIAGQPAGLDVSGPVGIAVMTGQVAQLGFGYLVRFAAMLSVNLAIINILPIPALDGGRILFILVEKLKGSPVSKKFEQRAHNLGFALLITLMLFVTARDLMKFDIIQKLKNIF